MSPEKLAPKQLTIEEIVEDERQHGEPITITLSPEEVARIEEVLKVSRKCIEKESTGKSGIGRTISEK